MDGVLTSGDKLLMAIQNIDQWQSTGGSRSPFYTILYITEGSGQFIADVGQFAFESPVLLFSTPLQKLSIMQAEEIKGYVLHFHGDFYCIEYHKERVACNGLLFNNIYIEPSVKPSEKETTAFTRLYEDILAEFAEAEPDDAVLRSYLQLFLAKSSSSKLRAMAGPAEEKKRDERMETFRSLIEENYLILHKPAEYAYRLAMSSSTLLRLCRQYYGKSPSAMIQERLILEAKKKLHLTRQSIKEIAFSLNFSDEFYFSRFFKKFTKVSPQGFRDSGGISIVADFASE